jgi:hypothetical protein
MNATEITKLKEQAKSNVYVPHGSVDSIDCVIGFSFGYLDNADGIKPGKSNQQLADFIEANFPNAPLLLQFEINDALRRRESNLVVRESRTESEYLNSREVADQALEYMQKRDWKTAVIVTHPAMEARNDAICKALGIITVTPEGLEEVEYDQNSAQPWTRDMGSWWTREDKAIDLCVTNGWL